MNYLVCKRNFGLAALALAVSLANAGQASATQSLSLGSVYNHTPITFTTASGTHTEAGGGDVQGSSLTNTVTHVTTALPYIYCLEWQVNVGVPATYTDSLVNSVGSLHNLPLVIGSSGAISALDVAKEIAWLMVNFAPSATTLDKQAGLQAVLWREDTPGFAFSSSNSAGVTTAYNAILNALNTARGNGSIGDLRSSVLFLSPSNNHDSGSSRYQGLVGMQATTTPTGPVATPEPATFALALSGLIPLGVVGLARRRGRVVKAENKTQD
jgi:hypothetical protein